MVWILFGLFALAYLIYLITTSLIEYLRYEVTLKIDRYQDLPATFPAITICNVNPFNEQYAYSYLRNSSSKAACFDLTNGDEFTTCYNSTDTSTAFDDFKQKLKRIVGNDITLTDADYNLIGYDLDYDMMISCTFNGQQCYATDFKQYWDNYYGNCYTFNYGNDNSSDSRYLKTSAFGVTNGLKLQHIVSK